MTKKDITQFNMRLRSEKVVLLFLRSHPDKSFTTDEIAGALSFTEISSSPTVEVDHACYGLNRKKKIERTYANGEEEWQAIKK